MADKVCTHKNQIKNFRPQDNTVCEDCIKDGDIWISLRQCLTCGHVSCCDSSKINMRPSIFKKQIVQS